MKKYLVLMLAMLTGCAISGMPENSTITEAAPQVGDLAYVKAEFANFNYSAGSKRTSTNSPSYIKEFVGEVIGIKRMGRITGTGNTLELELATLYAVKFDDVAHFIVVYSGCADVVKKVTAVEPNDGFAPDPALRGHCGP